jgi:hypothetical protein
MKIKLSTPHGEAEAEIPEGVDRITITLEPAEDDGNEIGLSVFVATPEVEYGEAILCTYLAIKPIFHIPQAGERITE